MSLDQHEVITDWKAAIVAMVAILQRVWELDEGGLWPRHLPNVAATEADLSRVEGQLGYVLDMDYRSFLFHADGWEGIYQWVDLFGTRELVGRAMAEAEERLRVLEDSGSLKTSGINLNQVVPIAASIHAADLFVLLRQGPGSGQVVWFAGAEVDRFATFSEWFLAMMDYNKMEIRDLESSN